MTTLKNRQLFPCRSVRERIRGRNSRQQLYEVPGDKETPHTLRRASIQLSFMSIIGRATWRCSSAARASLTSFSRNGTEHSGLRFNRPL